MDEQRPLTENLNRLLAVQHFDKVDPVQRRIAQDGGFALLVAVGVDHAPAP